VIRRQLVTAVLALALLTALTGLAYPLAVTAVAQVAFPARADGSLVHHDGRLIGSRLIGQSFAGSRWFHPRPSAAGDGYDAMSSSASNLGPTNPVLLAAVRERTAAYRKENGLRGTAKVPIDAVTASGSGLDPQISTANARLQASRVARARGLPVSRVLALVDEHTGRRSLWFLGEPGVNVLELNLALDALRR
jgi:potassium-transporting ATPase KdpC subunit